MRIHLVDSLLADLLQDVRFLRVYGCGLGKALAKIELNKNDSWTMLVEDRAAWRGRVRKLC